jgi:exosortase
MISKHTQSLKNVDYLLLITLFLSGFALSEALVQMVVLWVTTDTYMHGMFVLPLVAMMAVQMDKPNFKASNIPLFQAISISVLWSVSYLFASQSMINVLEQLVFISIIPLIVLLKSGWRYLWHYRTPLLLCFLCIPFGDFLVPHLQSVTADMSVWLLRMVGVPVLHNGWYITIAAADFRVAEACSGINFLISTFVVSVFYAFTYMQKTHKRIVFISLGILVPLLANGLRVFLIIMVAHWGNVEAATGFDHLVYGWIFFVFVLLILFAVGHLWSDPAIEHENKVQYLDLIKTGNRRGISVFLLALVPIIIVSGYLNSKSDQAQKDYESKNQLKVESVVKDPLGAAFPYADSVEKSYDNGVFTLIATYITEKQGKKLISYENQLFNKDVWSIKSRSVVKGESGNWERFVLVDLRGTTSVLYRRYVVDGSFIVGNISVKLSQTISRLTGQDFGGKVEIILIPIHMDSGTVPLRK